MPPKRTTTATTTTTTITNFSWFEDDGAPLAPPPYATENNLKLIFTIPQQDEHQQQETLFPEDQDMPDVAKIEQQDGEKIVQQEEHAHAVEGASNSFCFACKLAQIEKNCLMQTNTQQEAVVSGLELYIGSMIHQDKHQQQQQQDTKQVVIHGYDTELKKHQARLDPSILVKLFHNHFSLESAANPTLQPMILAYNHATRAFLREIALCRIAPDTLDEMQRFPIQFHNGTIVVRVLDMREAQKPKTATTTTTTTTQSEEFELTLKPDSSALQTDVNNFLEENFPDVPLTQDERLVIAQRVLHSINKGICIAPSPRVAIIANALQYNKQKHNYRRKRKRAIARKGIAHISAMAQQRKSEHLLLNFVATQGWKTMSQRIKTQANTTKAKKQKKKQPPPQPQGKSALLDPLAFFQTPLHKMIINNRPPNRARLLEFQATQDRRRVWKVQVYPVMSGKRYEAVIVPANNEQPSRWNLGSKHSMELYVARLKDMFTSSGKTKCTQDREFEYSPQTQTGQNPAVAGQTQVVPGQTQVPGTSAVQPLMPGTQQPQGMTPAPQVVPSAVQPQPVMGGISYGNNVIMTTPVAQRSMQNSSMTLPTPAAAVTSPQPVVTATPPAPAPASTRPSRASAQKKGSAKKGGKKGAETPSSPPPTPPTTSAPAPATAPSLVQSSPMQPAPASLPRSAPAPAMVTPQQQAAAMKRVQAGRGVMPTTLTPATPRMTAANKPATPTNAPSPAYPTSTPTTIFNTMAAGRGAAPGQKMGFISPQQLSAIYNQYMMPTPGAARGVPTVPAPASQQQPPQKK